VKVAVHWGRSGPIVERPGTCESCGQPFACELSLAGCWCSKIELTDAARAEMRSKYKNCLCPACLKQYARST
jgi:Cysteine-rich CWC